MNKKNCEICNGTDAIEVPNCRKYTDNEPIHICTNCGFVYVRERRSSQEIANSWSEEVFNYQISDVNYSAENPLFKARHTYVAEVIKEQIGLKDRSICDIGAGEGQFFDIIKNLDNTVQIFGIEPSAKNCRLFENANIAHFNGTIEAYFLENPFPRFDLVTAMWTAVNCYSCKDLANITHQIINPNGYIVVAESSRILVPFKKPLHLYLSKEPQDLHSFHFSANALKNLLRVAGFDVVYENRYIDNDILCIIGKKCNDKSSQALEKDNFLEVYNFFERWHTETEIYYKGVYNNA